MMLQKQSLAPTMEPIGVQLSPDGTNNDVSVSHLPDGIIVGERPVMIQAGVYDLSFEHHETANLFGGRAPKLVLWFRVATLGEHYGLLVPRYYNVRAFAGRGRRHGKFHIGWKSDFVREYARCFGLPRRIDRVSTAAFKGVLIEGRIDAVECDHHQRKIHNDLRYSVIRELLKVKEL